MSFRSYEYWHKTYRPDRRGICAMCRRRGVRLLCLQPVEDNPIKFYETFIERKLITQLFNVYLLGYDTEYCRVF